MKMIIATDVNGGIGFNNGLPWKCPEDMTYFKEQTTGNTVVIGRGTFEEVGQLPGRGSIVASKSGCKVYGRLSGELWLIGGKQTYESMIDDVDEIHHTLIQGQYECDTFVDMQELTIGFVFDRSIKLSDMATVSIYRRVK